MSFSSEGRIAEKEEDVSFSIRKPKKKEQEKENVRGFLKRKRKETKTINHQEKESKQRNKFLILGKKHNFIENRNLLFFLKCFAIFSFAWYLKRRRTIE